MTTNWADSFVKTATPCLVFFIGIVNKKLTLFLNKKMPGTFHARLTCLRSTSRSHLPFGAADTEDKDRPVFNADGMTNFSAGSGSKPEPYIVGKGGNNGDICRRIVLLKIVPNGPRGKKNGMGVGRIRNQSSLVVWHVKQPPDPPSPATIVV